MGFEYNEYLALPANTNVWNRVLYYSGSSHKEVERLTPTFNFGKKSQLKFSCWKVTNLFTLSQLEPYKI